jgi:uncharacterized protein DUF3455
LYGKREIGHADRWPLSLQMELHEDMTVNVRHLDTDAEVVVLRVIPKLEGRWRMYNRVPHPEVPDSIQVPAGEEVVLKVHATGFQIYVCEHSADQRLSWTLKRPEAKLLDANGKPVGSHSEGPIWKHSDGSQVAGKITGRADAPDAGSIPWLLLSASGHTGTGILSHVTSIQRIHTSGGQPPVRCDEANCGAEMRVSYSADYYFYESRR